MNYEEKEEYEKILLEILKDSPILRFLNGVIFLSHSKGKNKKRKYGCWIILLKTKHEKKWFFWKIRHSNYLSFKRYLFDKWATEIFGEEFCSHLSENPGEYLKNQILDLLEKLKRF